VSAVPHAPAAPDPVTPGQAAADRAADLKAGRYTVDLEIGGMTCASCSTRVEKRLNRMPGVTATVNLATGSAHAEVPDQVDVQALVAAVEAAGYTARRPAPPAADGEPEAQPAADPEHALLGRLVVSAVLSLPVLVVSMVPALQFDRWAWVALALTTPVALWGAWPFHRAAAVNARHGASTMDTLVSVGILAAWSWSLWAVLRGGAGEPGMRMTTSWLPWQAADQGAHPGRAEVYFEVAAVVTTFLLAGRLAEARARRRAGSALRALLDLGAKQATLLVDAPDDPGGRVEQRVPVGRLLVGDRFLVRPGERVPTDGVVLDGRGELDTSMLTGEPLPAPAGPGDPVVGGTVNLTGRLEVRATRVGEQTRLAQIARLVSAAQTGKAPVQRLADQVSAVFVPVVGVLALLTLVTWLAVTGDQDRAFTAAVAVLIVACPCALGLATPTALLVGTGRAAQLGILIKGPQVLESTRRADVVLLDKTGTLTEGRMALTAVVPVARAATPDDASVDAVDEALLLTRAAAVEAGSEHPIAAALVRGAAERGLPLPPVAGFASTAGQGVGGSVDGLTVTVGRVPPQAPEPVREQAAGLESDGATVVAVSWGGAVRGLLAVSDRLKPTSARAVAELAALGLRPVMLTGDNPGAAARIAAQAGIGATDVVAGATPESKLEAVRRLRAEGRVVAMVGDGVNDAAALAAADLGIAMGGGTDVAIQASDLTLTGGDLRAAATAVRLSRATLRTVRQNLFWAFGYNVAAIPLAALGLLNPMISGAAMAASSVLVVTNSLRLRRFQR
jgi:P-type Cu+ transporter